MRRACAPQYHRPSGKRRFLPLRFQGCGLFLLCSLQIAAGRSFAPLQSRFSAAFAERTASSVTVACCKAASYCAAVWQGTAQPTGAATAAKHRALIRFSVHLPPHGMDSIVPRAASSVDAPLAGGIRKLFHMKHFQPLAYACYSLWCG